MSLQDIYKEAGVVMKPAAMKDGKLYSQQPHSGAGDFNFSRADGVQTRINKHGLIETVANNEPRLSYSIVDGKVSDCPHLLLEPSRTNMLLRSEEFDNSTWVKQSSSVTANQIVSPDGSQTADLYTSSNATFEFIQQTISLTGSQYYTFSIFLKSGSTDKLTISLSGGAYSTSQNVDFNLTDKTHNITSGTPTFDIVDCGNGWVRCSMTTLTTSTSTALHRILIQGGEPNVSTYYLWGGQVELGSYATSYIPTSGSTETRQADICNGSGNSETFNSNEGVLFAEIAALADDGTNRHIGISDNTNTNRLQIFFNTHTTTQIRTLNLVGNVKYFDMTSDVTLVNAYIKVAIKYKENDFALWVNGVEVATDNSGLVWGDGVLDTLKFADGNDASSFYGKTKQLSTFKKALTDAELEKLTSWESFFDMAKGQEYNVKL